MLQTWLPYPNIYPSVSVLTDDELCKQRVDAKKILDTLENKSQTYRHHPAVKMWRGYSELLKGYLSGCLKEWTKRGHSNNMEWPQVMYSKVTMPEWWGKRIHASHKARLLYGNLNYYGNTSLGREVPSYVVYRSNPPKLFWPVKHNGQLR